MIRLALRHYGVASLLAIALYMSASVGYAQCGPDQILPASDGTAQDPSIDDVVGITQNGTQVLCTGVETQRIVTLQPVTGALVNIAPGALVQGPDAPILLDGNGNQVINSGTIFGNDVIAAAALFGIGVSVANLGTVSIEDGIGFWLEGAAASVINTATGAINVTNGEPEGIFIEGDNAQALNFGTVTLIGDQGEAIAIEGTGATLTNSGTVNGTGIGVSGLTVDGTGTVTNLGIVSIQGGTNLGLAAYGDVQVLNAEGGGVSLDGNVGVALGQLGPGGTVVNQGTVDTDGTFSLGALALSASPNDPASPNVLNDANATITTHGDNSAALALGMQADSVPSDVSLPGVIQALTAFSAIGRAANRGELVTEGDNSDGMHGFASNSGFTNTGSIVTFGSESSGISVQGDGNTLLNSSSIESGSDSSENARGIEFSGNSVAQNDGDIDVSGLNPIGIDAAVTNPANSMLVENSGAIAADGISAIGIRISAPSDSTSSVPGGVSRVCTAADGDSNAVNCGVIEATGAASTGIVVNGDGLQAENTGDIFLGDDEAKGVALNGSDLTLLQDGRIGGVSAGAGIAIIDDAIGISIEGSQATVVNDGEIEIDGADVYGMRATEADEADIRNTADIILEGAGARGISVEGNDVVVANGAFADAGADADIEISGSGGIGIETTGNSAFVSNQSAFQGTSDEINYGIALENAANGRGIEVSATGSGAFLVENGGNISVEGNDSIGIALVNTTNAAITTSANTSLESECLGAPTGALINCGAIGIQGARSVGMAALGISDTYIENSGLIVGTGQGATGIVVGESGSGVGSNNNIILSIDDIVIESTSGARGVVIEGNDNILVHGQGAISVPIEGAPIPTEQIISVQIDQDSSSQDYPNFSVAGIDVSGTGAVGISVTGNDNTIAILPVATLNGDVEATVRAGPNAAGTIGIQLSGNNNLVLNQGRVEGATGIQGGDGVDRVQNLGTLIGGADLGAGNDVFEMAPVFPEGSSLSGTVNGGTGNDLLQVNSVTLPAAATSAGALNGDQFVNFEQFLLTTAPTIPVGSDNAIAGNNLVTMSGTLGLSGEATATLQENTTLSLNDGNLAASEINLQSGSLLTGNGRVGALPEGPGGFDSSNINVFGGVSSGNSSGSIDFLGNLNLFGFMEIEIGGTDFGLFDSIFIQDDFNIFGGELRFSFIDDFLPSADNQFDFLNVGGGIFGLDSLNISVLGLSDGLDFNLGLTGSGLSFDVMMADNSDPVGVPEPGTLALLASGLLGFFAIRRRRPRIASAG